MTHQISVYKENGDTIETSVHQAQGGLYSAWLMAARLVESVPDGAVTICEVNGDTISDPVRTLYGVTVDD